MPISVTLKLHTGEEKKQSCLNEDMITPCTIEDPNIKKIMVTLGGYCYDDRIVKEIIDESTDFSTELIVVLTEEIKSFDEIVDGNFYPVPEPKILRKKHEN